MTFSEDFRPVERVTELLLPIGAPWWVAGGWAVDLHVRRLTRAHTDIDVQVLQRDVPLFAASLGALYAERAESGERIDWDRRRPLVPGPESLAIEADFGGGITKAQLLVGLAEGDQWVYHRGNGSLRRGMDELTRHSLNGVPYLAPDIVLLFKSRQLRPKDTQDFQTLVPVLTTAERSWIRANLMRWRADHPWLSYLEE